MDEGLAAFDARTAFPAMNLAAFVTRPGAGKIHSEARPFLSDLRFAERDKRPQQTNLRIRSASDRVTLRLHEVFPTIGINRVIAAVRCDHEAVSRDAFRESARDR